MIQLPEPHEVQTVPPEPLKRPRRPKGTGCLIPPRQAGGSWYVAYYADGRRKQESAGTTNEAEAGRVLQRKLNQAAQGHWVGSARVKINDLLADLLTDYAVRRLSSLKTVKAHMPRLRKTFGHLKPTRVTRPALMRAVQQWQNGGLMPATINKHLGTLRRAYTLAVENKKIGRGAVPSFPTLEENNARQTYVGVADMERIIQEMLDDGLRDFVDWLYGSSQRWGEVAAMTWDMFNHETWELRIPGKLTKARQARVLPVLAVEHLRPILERRLVARRLDCASIFHRNGKKITAFVKSWRSACARAGFIGKREGGITPHDLRHIAATDLLEAGVPETIIMQIGGWETASMFRRYAIKRKEMIVDGLNRLGRFRTEARQAGPKVSAINGAR